MRTPHRLAAPLTAVTAVLAAVSLTFVGPIAPAKAQATVSATLEAEMLRAVQDARFGETIEFGPFEDVCPGADFCPNPALPVRYMPNVDVSVIELDNNGQALRTANVLLSRDYPDGVIAPIDRAGGPAGSYGVSGVRWRAWDIDRYNGGTFSQTDGTQLTVKGWSDNPPLTAADDIVPGRASAPLEFMAPYPASLFKIVVAFRIMRLVDAGHLSLKTKYSYDTTSDPLPPAAARGEEERSDKPPHGGKTTPRPTPKDRETRTIRDWMDPMITVSDNHSTRALLKLLHDRNDIPAMHAELAGMGLGTLQINGTLPASGRNWQPGLIHMTSMDTARLLWLIEGGTGTLWARPDGSPVLASMLTTGSRGYLKSLLDDQAFHEVLSTGSLCNAPNVEPGIPALVPSRWINPDGTESGGGYHYGYDVRPCNAAAEVAFGHKTGLTFNYGTDAGIVRSLPGKPDRRYVISFNSSLGYRYTDPVFASRSSYPCYDAVGAICYTQRIPALAKELDDFLRSAA
ncbi:MAG TPA: serine hydrolase [Acidimicrobiales bacterium]|nr:serine hydrolase [Acidimicrobiales bacterium]